MLDGAAIGEHALAGALRYFAVGSLEREPLGEHVLRRYFEAALLTAFATRALLKAIEFTSLVSTHGIYVPWGVVSEVGRTQGVHVVNWCAAYRRDRFLFSHDHTYHHELVTESTDYWVGRALSDAEDQELTAYLLTRRDGRSDWRAVHQPGAHSKADLIRALGVDPAKPIIGLLTNVIWDAQVHYANRAFPDMLDWLLRTCEYFEQRPDLQLLIRLHPSEITGAPATRQPVLAELRRRFPMFPPNIFVVPPDSDQSTYDLMSMCDAVIIYATVTGIELTSLGIPVIVAGEAWVRNKGITDDASTTREYFEILDRLPFGARLNEQQQSRARGYAYHFFFNRLLQLPFVRQTPGYRTFGLDLHSLDALKPGRSPIVDLLCDGVLDRKPFVAGAHAPPAP